MDDVYYIIKKTASQETKVKGSRFIGTVSHAKDREEAESFIQEVRKKYHSATHHCSAYRIGHGDASVFRYNDDGEPGGTAGKPILEAIDGRNLTDVICVVTRYFGGTKLGTGGLTRAYGACAALTLDEAGKRRCYVSDRLHIRFDYNLTGVVMGIITRFGADILKSSYGSETELVLRIRKSMREPMEKALIDAAAGHIQVSLEEVSRH